jgi:hypothetical protein
MRLQHWVWFQTLRLSPVNRDKKVVVFLFDKLPSPEFDTGAKNCELQLDHLAWEFLSLAAQVFLTEIHARTDRDVRGV